MNTKSTNYIGSRLTLNVFSKDGLPGESLSMRYLNKHKISDIFCVKIWSKSVSMTLQATC